MPLHRQVIWGLIWKHTVEKSKKCNQCDYTSSRADHFRTHLITHSGEKSNKCNQCDFVSSRALPGTLRTHLKRHIGGKSNKCNQCDYASYRACDLRTHLKTHSGEKSNKCNQYDYVLSVSMFTIVNCFHGTPIELCGAPQHGGTSGTLSLQTSPTQWVRFHA